jgi:Uma2 family endonuclease
MATAPAAGTTGLTYDDLLSFPDDGLRRELIDGELFVTPSPSFRHEGVVTELVIALGLYGRAHGGKVRPAPMDVFLSERDVVEPDVLFLTAANLSRAERPFIRGAPDVVVEVSSPSTRRHDLVRKLELYERFGVPEYRIVDQQLTSPLLPGFEASVDALLGPADEADAAP